MPFAAQRQPAELPSGEISPRDLVQYLCFRDSLHRMSNLVTTISIASSNIGLVVNNLHSIADRLSPLHPRLQNMDSCATDLVATLSAIRGVGRYDAGQSLAAQWAQLGQRVAITNADALQHAGWTLACDGMVADGAALPILADAELVLTRLVAGTIAAGGALAPAELRLTLHRPGDGLVIELVQAGERAPPVAVDATAARLAGLLGLAVESDHGRIRLMAPGG